MLLEIKNGTVSQNGKTILSHFNFEIRGTEKAALVGRNGSGKTTLLELLGQERTLDSDEKHPESGAFASRSFTYAILHQNAVKNPGMTVEESIRTAFEEKQKNTGLVEDPKKFELDFDRLFTKLSFSLDDKKKHLGDFSGGEQTKIMLIRVLLIRPEVLLLDEPTNYIDLKTLEWLEAEIRQYPGAVIFVSHDRYFIDQTADTIWEIRNGQATRFSGNYTSYKSQKRVLTEKQEKAYEAQQQEIKRLNSLIERFKHKPRKAAFARSRKKILERMPKIEKPDFEDTIRVHEIIPDHPGPKLVLDAKKILIGYKEPLKEVSFRLRRGQKMGIFGPNGSGKSTLLKTIAKKIPPYEGTVISAGQTDEANDPDEAKKHARRLRIGRHIVPAYFDQFSSQITSSKTVAQWFHDLFPELKKEEIRSFLAEFLFRGEDLAKTVSRLSGGERARLVLASILYQKPNFLILDEPTSHMDIPSREAIEAILEKYQGTLLFVSHDRYFLSRLADCLLIFEDDSAGVRYCPYSYHVYQRLQKQKASGQSLSDLQSAEEQRLIEGLRSVPEKDRPIHELSTTAASFDWEFDLNRKPSEEAETRFQEAEALACQAPQTLNEWKEWDALTQKRMEDSENACMKWTQYLIEWYDIWQDTPAGIQHTSEDETQG